MTDRELLEMAGKAAGLRITWGEKYHVGDAEVDCTDMPFYVSGDREESPAYWNPLEDDGDALRLAVKLGLEVSCDGRDKVIVGWPDPSHPGSGAEDECVFYSHMVEAKGEDHCIATRRAIVRAAAEIGAKQ